MCPIYFCCVWLDWNDGVSHSYGVGFIICSYDLPDMHDVINCDKCIIFHFGIM